MSDTIVLADSCSECDRVRGLPKAFSFSERDRQLVIMFVGGLALNIALSGGLILLHTSWWIHVCLVDIAVGAAAFYGAMRWFRQRTWKLWCFTRRVDVSELEYHVHADRPGAGFGAGGVHVLHLDLGKRTAVLEAKPWGTSNWGVSFVSEYDIQIVGMDGRTMTVEPIEYFRVLGVTLSSVGEVVWAAIEFKEQSRKVS